MILLFNLFSFSVCHMKYRVPPLQGVGLFSQWDINSCSCCWRLLGPVCLNRVFSGRARDLEGFWFFDFLSWVGFVWVFLRDCCYLKSVWK